jgi:hypothetical protein
MKNKTSFWDIANRVFSFPFICLTTLIGALLLWLKWMKNFVLYGGEFIAYTKSNTRSTINDIFKKLEDDNKS